MKKSIVSILFVSAVVLGGMTVVSCGEKKATATEDTTGESTDPTNQENNGTVSNTTEGIDSAKYEAKDKYAEVVIKAEYIKTDNKALYNNIAEYISEELGGTNAGDLTDIKSMLEEYVKAEKKELTAMSKEFFDEGSAAMPYAYDSEIEVIENNDKFVTLTNSTYTFQGGAHGFMSVTGKTFRKSDGRRFGKEMLRNTSDEKFVKLMIEGVKSYFRENGVNISNDEELLMYLQIGESVDELPLPQSEPYLTDKGVTFIYQQYEIAPYAAGIPTFTISYEKMKPFLTQTVLNLIK